MEEKEFGLEKEREERENPYVGKFLSFFESVYRKEIERLVQEYPQKKSLEVDFKKLEEYDFELADELLENPDYLLQACHTAIQGVEVPALEVESFTPYVRFHNLPKDREVLIRDIGAEFLNKMVSVEGVIRQITDALPKLKLATWQCRRCGNTYKTPQENQEIKMPAFCECRHRDFNLVQEQSDFIDYQKVQVQEPLEKLKGNEQASYLDIYLSDDLVHKVNAGDKVRFSGVLRLYPSQGKKIVFGRFLETTYAEETEREFEEVEINPEEEKQIKELSVNPKIYEMLTASIAPAIYGHDAVKESIVLQLFGGVKKYLPGEQTIRGNVHILLVGDPGCLIADERIVMGNGAIEKMGNLGREHLEDINLQVLTGEGGAKRDTATVFHFYPQQQVMEIITESGKSIKGTPNHPLMSVSKKNGKVLREWKRLDEFEIGNKVAVVTGIPCTITKPIPTGFEALGRRLGPKFKGKLPEKVTPEFGGLLGYLTGDGWVRKYETAFVVSEDEKDLLPLLLKKCKSLFGKEPSVTRRKLDGRKMWLSYASIYSKDIAHNLVFLRDKRVPDLVLQSGNKVAAEFLKWLYEADGCAFSKGEGRRSVSLKSKSIELLRDVQVLLLRFGVHSRIVERNLFIRRGRDIIKFAEKIG